MTPPRQGVLGATRSWERPRASSPPGPQGGRGWWHGAALPRPWLWPNDTDFRVLVVLSHPNLWQFVPAAIGNHTSTKTWIRCFEVGPESCLSSDLVNYSSGGSSVCWHLHPSSKASSGSSGFHKKQRMETLENYRVAMALSPAGLIGSIMLLGLSVSVSLHPSSLSSSALTLLPGTLLTKNSRLTACRALIEQRDALFPCELSKSLGAEWQCWELPLCLLAWAHFTFTLIN